MLSFESGGGGNSIKMFLKSISFGGIRFLWGFVLSKNGNASLGSGGIAMSEFIIWLSLLCNSNASLGASGIAMGEFIVWLSFLGNSYASLSSSSITVGEFIIWLLGNGNTSLCSGGIAMSEFVIWLRFLSVHGIKSGVSDSLEWSSSSVLHVNL